MKIPSYHLCCMSIAIHFAILATVLIGFWSVNRRLRRMEHHLSRMESRLASWLHDIAAVLLKVHGSEGNRDSFLEDIGAVLLKLHDSTNPRG